VLLTAIVVVVFGGALSVWESHRHAGEPLDEEFEEREARYGRRLVTAWLSVLAVLVVGLVLDGVGAPGVGWLVLLALAAMLLLFYAAPFFGPRRTRRSGRESPPRRWR
jgi:uncharacterized RDD family membrane protein YckC